MDANKWSMVEDLGSLLVPRADKSVGLENISRRLAAVERWIDRWLRFARYGLRFIGPLIAILAVWILSEWASAPTGFWPSRLAQSGLSVIVALAFAATICVIPIQAMQYAAQVGLVPKVLRDPGLAPIKDYLKRCASGTISVFDKKGAKVDQSTFASPWAILLVPSHRRFRGIRLIGATRPYPDPLAVERPKGAQPRVPQVLQPTVNVLIDRRSTVVAIDQSVKADGQSVDWRPRQWGAAKSEAFTPGSIELMKGDRIEFNRNDRALGRENGAQASVIATNSDERTARIRLYNGRFQTLDLDNAADQHVRHGYVQTAHAAQGRTADRVMIHADSRATNLVDQKMIYVAISRAKVSASLLDVRAN
jgi:Viral (Superfamily 1) RNA helicase